MNGEVCITRLEVFVEGHALTQYEQAPKPWLPFDPVGKTSLVAKLVYQTSMPHAIKNLAGAHMEP